MAQTGQNAIKFRQLLYVLRVTLPLLHPSLCVPMCFSDDKADLCPIGFAAKSHNSCFYDRMPIKALNVANCRRFFNKYKMCQAQRQQQRQRPEEKVSRRSTHKANALPLILSRALACPCSACVSFGRTHTLLRTYGPFTGALLFI